LKIHHGRKVSFSYRPSNHNHSGEIDKLNLNLLNSFCPNWIPKFSGSTAEVSGRPERFFAEFNHAAPELGELAREILKEKK